MTNGASTSDAAPQDPHLGEITDAADGRVILRALVSLGGRQLGIDQTWVAAPPVPSPQECERRDNTSLAGHSFTDHADVRLAGQQPGDRHVRYWARLSGELLATGNQSFAITRITGPLGSPQE